MSVSATAQPPEAPADGVIDPRAFRDAVGRFATGVTIVTVRGIDGRPVGLTANSFTSVSLDPPLVLWSLAKKSANRENYLRASGFAIHVLGRDHLWLAQRFASAAGERFSGLDFQSGHAGAPLLEHFSARLDCRTFNRIDAGDHDVFIGRVIAMELLNEAEYPLVFHRGEFVALDRSDIASS